MPRPKNKQPEAPSTKQNSQRDHQETNKPTLKVVGIGASAGGLVALQGFFDTLPPDTGMAFVIITHMDPERESLLPELLQSHTVMPVHQVQGKIAIEPNSVYVISPNRRIVMTDHQLDVEEFDEPRGQRMPIDHFFRSLAQVHRDAVAVILSGGGADGAVGVKNVKEQGGLLLVQHPDEAEHDSMPRAAIATGLADMVLPVRQLAQKLVAYQQNGITLPINSGTLTERDLDFVRRILSQVQARTGHDFSQYKQSTLLRRIERRMHLTEHVFLDAYLKHLRQTPDEARTLFNDLLIGVTNFFRDQESWQALADQVIPQLFEGKGVGQRLRIWTIGCSTGEEAYTVAMLLLEYAAQLDDGEDIDHVLTDRPLELQVFASDLDDIALAKAREGLYPEAIETDVSAERLNRFFTKEGQYYRVRRELRDIVLFTNHSVLRDPPFSRIDLISCRNLLIYLNRDLQENVLDIFHYALEPEGYLFLGSAESANQVDNLFRTVDKTHRIYQARPWRGEYPHVPSLPLTVRTPLQGVMLDSQIGPSSRASERRKTASTLHQGALEAYGPPTILIDEYHHILHVSETAGRYLLVRRGSLSSDLIDLIRPELQFELRMALLQAFRLNKAVVTAAVHVQFNGTPHRVILSVRPQQTRTEHDLSSSEALATEDKVENGGNKEEQAPVGEWLALVVFLEHEADEIESQVDLLPEIESETKQLGNNHALLKQLQAEVRQLRERARSSAEEYESANEELKAANEELQSINEEYRSTAEELETSKEELQSLNEELQTVNSELKNKLEEISHINSDLENLMASTQIATLFLDREFRIRHFTPSMEPLFNILPGDRGRSITHLTNKLDYAALTEDAALVLRTLVPIEREIYSQAGKWFLVRLRPYRTVDDRIDGIVLTFVDVTALKTAEAELRNAKEYSEKIVDTVRGGLLVLEPDLSIQFANTSFLQMFQVAEEDTIGTLIYRLNDGQWDISRLRELLEEILPQEKTLNDFQIEHNFKGIGQRIILLNARKLRHDNLILLGVEDITLIAQHEQRISTLHATSAALANVIMSQEAIWAIIDQIMPELDAHHGIVGLVSNDGRMLELVRPASLSEENFERYRYAAMNVPNPMTDAIRSNTPIWLETQMQYVEQYPSHRELIQNVTKAQAAIALPLRTHSQVIGSLMFSFPEARTQNSEEQDFLQTIADYLAQSIERSQLYEAERQTRELLQTRVNLQSVISVLGQEALVKLDIDALMNQAVIHLAQILDVEYTKILELTPDEDHLLLKAGVGWKEGLVGQAYVSTGRDSQAGYTLLHHQPVIVEDILTETRFNGPSLLLEHHVISGMNVIIEGHTKPWGVLGIHSTKHRIFTSDDIYFVLSVANILASALERERLVTVVEAQRQHITSIINTVPGVIWENRHEDESEAMQLVFVSAYVETMLGYTVEEVLADPHFWFKIFHPEDAEATAQAFYRVRQSHGSGTVNFRAIHKDGHIIDIQALMTTILEGDKSVGKRGVMMDVSERQHLIRVQDRYAGLLRRSNEELQQFAYVASHDLQSPLRQVISYLQLLDNRYEDQLDADARDFIQFAVDAAAHMSNLINALLAYARIDREEEVFEEINVQAVVDKAIKYLSLQIEDSGTIITQDDLPQIKANPLQLTQLFQNLIGNAITYQGDLSPQIHIGVERKPNEWEFSVRDNGIGMAPDSLDRIFAIFQRLHTKEKYPGTGIGLAICKKIVEHHGGRIWAESTPGQGTTFYFAIPI